MKKPPFLTPMYITFNNNLCWIGNFERGEKVLLLIGCTKIARYIHDVICLKDPISPIDDRFHLTEGG